MYKLVVSSFDNTLINSEEAISTSTMIKLDEIRNRGILFGISTNRCYREILTYNRDFPFIDYIISYNGAYVYDVNKNKCIFKKSLLLSIIKKIYNYFIDYDLLFYTEDNYYTKIDICDEFFKKNKIYKICICCRNKNNLKEVSNLLSLLNLDINFYKDDSNYIIEIIRGSINKFCGLESICKNKISLDDVVVIGYDFSDKEILENVGYSVIVSNGDKGLKNIVSCVTSSNNDKGVERILEKLM